MFSLNDESNGLILKLNYFVELKKGVFGVETVIITLLLSNNGSAPGGYKTQTV